ncbi:hypothetical protein AAG747_05730 [Rapidithrix thailandica]|uniref:Uncharacterized protein n=1 Tax=Rapidithrix thailandica TaxID=413964 RepID=A0AAW9S4Q7_9BACT
MVSEIEMALLEQFAFGEIGEQDFIESYPVNLLNNKNYLINLIEVMIKNKDADNLSLLLDVIASLSLYKDYDIQSVYRKLIKVNWHQMHEELVDSLDKSAVNEDYFIYVLNSLYDYHKDGVEDFMVPIWSKCLWSLYKIKTRKSIDMIKQYVNSEYEYLRETSKKNLSKLNE